MKDNGKNEYLMEEQNKEGSFFVTTQFKPKNEVKFHNGDRNIGRLDFNGGVMVFEGDAEESAKIFFDALAEKFSDRLKEEREKEREACARICDHHANVWNDDLEDWRQGYIDGAAACFNVIRARGWE